MSGEGPLTRSKRRRCVDSQNSGSCNRPDGSQNAGPDHLVITSDSQPSSIDQLKSAKVFTLPDKTSNKSGTGPLGNVLEEDLSASPPASSSTNRCDTSTSTGFMQPAQVTKCLEPVRCMRSPSPVAASSTDQSNSASSGEVAHPARIMRCTLPVRSMRNPSLAACSSKSQCNLSDVGEVTHPARVMRCAVPVGSVKSWRSAAVIASDSTSPTGPMQCYASPHGSGVLSGPSVKIVPSYPRDDCEPSIPSGMIAGSKRLKSQSQQTKSKQRSTKSISEEVSEPEILKCRQGQSSYSLRALKTVPLYNENVFGITYKSKCTKYDGIKDHAIEFNNNNNKDDYEEEEIALFQKTDFDNSGINLLPNEILSMIFSYLSHVDLLRNCSRVCHRWLSVAMYPNLWQTLSFCGQDTPIQVVCGCIRLSPTLKSITLKDRLDIDVILPILHQQCKRLESINLVRCRPCDGTKRNLKAKALYPFLRKGQLRSLSLKGTDYRSRKFYQMLCCLPNFQKLNISCSKSITPQILREIGQNRNLKVFKNKWHSHSVYHGPKSMTIQLPGKIDDWVKAYTVLFQNAGENLTTLEFYAAGINDTALSGLSSCKKLKKLFAYNANCFASESMAAIGSLPELQELLIHNAKLTTTDVVNAFQTGNLAGLKCLHLNDCNLTNSTNDVSTDYCLKTVAENCQLLQHLSFTKCSTVSDTGVLSVLTNCPNLISLDLNCAFGVSGQAFLQIPKCSPGLKFLVIEEDCSEEKSKIIKKLIESNGISVDSISTWKGRSTSYLL